MQEFPEPIAGRYRLQHCLHHGGMSVVYLAYDELLQHEVAIKLVSNDQFESRQRLQSEIQTLSNLSHEHILTILDHGEFGMYHYLVMPYLKHGTLRERVAKGRLTADEAGKIFTQLASALQFAHNHGIVHRDIKPSNILLDGDTNQHVYLSDFGLAKVIDKGSDLTQTGCLIGTPAYMAPELINKPESVSSDIYALGVLLYHMLTGHVPFKGSSPLAVYWKHMRELPVSPSQLNPAITAPVEQVILRALHKDPHRRFPGAQAMAQAYMNALQQSKDTVAHLAVQSFEPTMARRALKQAGRITLPTVLLNRISIPWWQNPLHNFQKVIISLALLALFITPLSLGFLVGRANAPLPLAERAQFAQPLQQPPHVPAQQTTPTVHPSSGNSIPQQFKPTSPPHKHKHKHPNNKNGGENEGEQASM
jgi:serine/threonine protein kinase